jgi:hypothetical protein
MQVGLVGFAAVLLLAPSYALISIYRTVNDKGLTLGSCAYSLRLLALLSYGRAAAHSGRWSEVELIKR